ncbi:MgtC/SapB family protein [uncultured Bosea sp.]|uniref:MgtC/SapB family protein n=1 Tax=uncultured Bosea sp. TaxID=211457 RepID=UPI0025F76294|nr:MgtC/SapB family protein [uncultured Bosea sp.]
MRFVQTFELVPFLDTCISLLAAFVLGALIGAERQYRQRTAGLRTTVLVAVGAAAFVDLAMRLAGADGAIRVIAYVVSGIGFLGAGVIMKEGMNVRGLNTAATLWCSAAVGACTGADMIAEATLVTVFVIAGNTLLRPLVNAINRIPLNERALEATYEVVVTTSAAALAATRDTLIEQLEAAQYPVSDVTTIERSDDAVDIVARLISTAVDRRELDHVVEKLERVPAVSHATWESSTTD